MSDWALGAASPEKPPTLYKHEVFARARLQLDPGSGFAVSSSAEPIGMRRMEEETKVVGLEPAIATSRRRHDRRGENL
jgi:hypothetical protein